MSVQFKDANGDPLDYWPISGLKAGEDSQEIEFSFVIPDGVVRLRSSQNPNAEIWAKKVGDASFRNISEESYDLTPLPKVETFFVAYVHALGDIEGLQREILGLGTGTSSKAGWSE